jgi:hypothetical protein
VIRNETFGGPKKLLLMLRNDRYFSRILCQGESPDISGGSMASAGARAYMGVWGPCPQRGPGAELLVGGQGAKPPEAESFLTV